MFWRIALIMFVLWSASQATAHDENTLDPHNATPGLHLELKELPRTSTSASLKYRLHAIGFPRGVVFNLWAEDFGRLFHLVGSAFQVDESGNVLSSKLSGPSREGKSTQITLGPGPYPRGVAWQVALVSFDNALRAFTAVIPHPIIARKGPCMVQLELVSYRGDNFVATGSGFASGDEVSTELRYAGSVIEKRAQISAEGKLPPQVLLHASTGADRRARYTVTGRSCKVAIDYAWGEPALSRR
jgi:hypothetical protein